MNRSWGTSGSSSWPKSKPSNNRKRSVKKKASSLPAVSHSTTQLTPSVYNLRPPTAHNRPKSSQRPTGHRPSTGLRSFSQQSPPNNLYSNQVYYSSSFECLVDNLEPPSSTASTSLTTELGNPRYSWTLSRRKKDGFPFQLLPTDCKLKVFSYFNAQEKGCLASVCQEWSQLIKTLSLWKVVDFTDFSFLCLPRARHHTPSVGVPVCIQCHRKRITKFTKHLLRLKPPITRLIFNYDIGDTCDGWLDILNRLLDGIQCRDLVYVQLKWKETPMKPFGSDNTVSENSATFTFRHRRRHRLFVNLFDKFTTAAPNVQTLILPFGWSERSVDSLCRLKSLHSLVLERYFVFQRLDQTMLFKLMAGLPKLKRLMLEVWTPSGPGLTKYILKSSSIEYLDISQSRGFYLQEVDLPNLKQFFVARHPWNGPLVMADQVNLQCLYTTLVNGAPNLSQLNGHVLESDWRANLYPQLDQALKAVCSCRQHKPGWAM